MLRFTISLFLVAILVVLTAWLGSAQEWWPLPLFWKEIVLFMFFITLIIGFRLVKMRSKQAVAFVQFYLLSITLKMAAGLAFIIFIILKTPTEAKGSAVLFIICYLVFTLIEVNFLIRKDPS